MSPGRCKPSFEAMRSNVNWTLGNKFQYHFSRNTSFSFKKMRLNMSSAKIAANLSRPHCVNNLVTISTTTRFGERSAELILMTWEMISFFSRQMKTFVSEVVFTQISARFSLVSVYVSIFFLDHYGICHLISKKAIDPNVCLSQSYSRISFNISPRQFHIPGNIWRVILRFEAGRVLVWHWRLELLLSHHYSVIYD